MEIPFRLRIDTAGMEAGHHGPDSMKGAVDALAGTASLEDKETLAAFRKAVHLDPTDPDYYYILGEALVRLGRQAEALPALGEAIHLNPTDPDYRYARGEALWELGRFEQAVAELREAARMRPGDARVQNALGAALVRAGAEREAVGVLRSAVHLDHDRATAHGNLGAALWSSGETEEGLRCFRTAVRLEPSSRDALRNLALALGASGQQEEALRSLGHLTRAHPTDPEAHLDLGDALQSAGRTAEAAKAYDEALRLDPLCMRARPASREARDAIALERVHQEVKAEARGRPRLGVALWRGLFAAARGLASAPRGIALFVWLGVAVVAGHSLWIVLPPYVTHYLLQDKVREIARAPNVEDVDIRDRLEHAVRHYGLEALIPDGSFEVHSQGKWRTIRCDYERSVQVLPGVTWRLRFRIRVEEPYVDDKDPELL